jgi:hypothetical protein
MPHLPGDAAMAEATFAKGQEYVIVPAKDVRPVPKVSRRARLAERLASRNNPQFARASANRLWAMMLGRGLVHPIELDHEGNPPSHPELLDVLSHEFVEMSCDVKAFLREIALSETYQRSSELPANAKDVSPKLFAVVPLRALSPEQLAWSVMQATGLTDAERLALGKNASETAITAKLGGNVAAFVRVFGGVRGQPEPASLQATSDQALFLSNGAQVRGCLAPRAGNLTDRLSKLSDPVAVADESYLSVLTRRPAADEAKDVAEHLKGRDKDRAVAVQELVWALLASAEFRFNH